MHRFVAASKLGSEELDQVATAAGIAPLVVVPSQNFDALVADDFGVAGVDDGGVRVGFEVGRDELFFGVTENAFHWSLRGGFKCRVDGLDGRGLFDESG